MRTEDSFFVEHLRRMLNSLYSRVDEIENGDLSPEDEMELAALDRLILILEAV